jgi:hypothetical protein
MRFPFIRWMWDSLTTGKPSRLMREAERAVNNARTEAQFAHARQLLNEWQALYGRTKASS